jgi:type IV pilus assembly protein PilA
VFDAVEPGAPLPNVRPPMPWYGWVVNILFVALVPIAILAAIALPAYQGYVSKAQAMNGMVAADAAKMAVTTFYAAQNRCPESGEEAGFSAPAAAGGYVSDVSIKADCRIVVTFAGSSAVTTQLRGQQIEMTGVPDAGSLTWTCAGSIPDPLLPSFCHD